MTEKAKKFRLSEGVEVLFIKNVPHPPWLQGLCLLVSVHLYVFFCSGDAVVCCGGDASASLLGQSCCDHSCQIVLNEVFLRWDANLLFLNLVYEFLGCVFVITLLLCTLICAAVQNPHAYID